MKDRKEALFSVRFWCVISQTMTVLPILIHVAPLY